MGVLLHLKHILCTVEQFVDLFVFVDYALLFSWKVKLPVY
jgi:hypothetical protein